MNFTGYELLKKNEDNFKKYIEENSLLHKIAIVENIPDGLPTYYDNDQFGDNMGFLFNEKQNLKKFNFQEETRIYVPHFERIQRTNFVLLTKNKEYLEKSIEQLLGILKEKIVREDNFLLWKFLILCYNEIKGKIQISEKELGKFFSVKKEEYFEDRIIISSTKLSKRFLRGNIIQLELPKEICIVMWKWALWMPYHALWETIIIDKEPDYLGILAYTLQGLFFNSQRCEFFIVK